MAETKRENKKMTDFNLITNKILFLSGLRLASSHITASPYIHWYGQQDTREDGFEDRANIWPILFQ